MNKDQRIAREKDLLAVALQCYASDQWESVTIANIAKQAGVAKGTVYLHFASKHEIFAHLALQFHEELLKRCHSVEASTGRKQLEGMLKQVFLHCEHEQQYRHVVQYCQRYHFRQSIEPELAERLMFASAKLRQLIRDCLDRGAADKSLLNSPPTTADGILCTITGAVQKYWSETNQNHENQMQFIAATTIYILSSVVEHPKKLSTTDSVHSPLDLMLES